MSWPFRLTCVLLVALSLSAQRPAGAYSTGRAFQVNGTVVDAVNGGPVAHAQVKLAPALNPSAERVVFADDSGHFGFDHVGPAKYVLTAEARGFPLQAFDQHENFSSAIVVGPGLVSDDLTFRLQPGAAISGTVTDEFNEAVRSGRVILFRDAVGDGKRGVHVVRQSSVDDLGAFRFSGLPPGKYFVMVEAQPWYTQGGLRVVSGPGSSFAQSDRSFDVAYPLTFYPNATDSAAATAILLKPGEQATADVNLRTVPSLHFEIRVPKGSPFAVTLKEKVFDGYENTVPTQNRNNEGSLEVGSVAPGHYLVQLDSFDPKTRSTVFREIDLFSDTDLDLQQPQGSSVVSGKVVVEGASALPSSTFILLRDRTSGQVFPGPILPTGEFEIQQSLQPATYDALVVNAPGFRTTSVSAEGARVTGNGVQIRDGAAVRLAVTVSRGLGQVDGIALNDEHPAAGVMIVLVPQNLAGNLSLVPRDQSDSDGTFTLPDVLPGSYTVVAIRNGWDLEWANPAVLKPYLPGGQMIQVQANGKYKIKVNVQ
jgi:hypothetical protein